MVVVAIGEAAAEGAFHNPFYDLLDWCDRCGGEIVGDDLRFAICNLQLALTPALSRSTRRGGKGGGCRDLVSDFFLCRCYGIFIFLVRLLVEVFIRLDVERLAEFGAVAVEGVGL